MEGRHFGTRKHLFDYDSVIDKQRHSIYARRDAIVDALHNMNHQLEAREGQKTVVDSVIDLIQASVEDFLVTQQTLWTSKEELIELINKEYGLNLETSHITSSLYNQSAQHITAHIISKLENGKELLWEEVFTRIISNIYLSMIDKNRVEHIDEMQYLREKVSLMWYAQLDPLVIYKKESYEKYKTLNNVINTSTVNMIANTDFDRISQQIQAQQQQQLNLIAEQENNNPDIIAKLKWAIKEGNNNPNKKNLTISSSNSEFEVIEMNEENNQTTSPKNIGNTKIRPNDKINVRYTDGKMLWDVKYKTVKEDIKSGKCQII